MKTLSTALFLLALAMTGCLPQGNQDSSGQPGSKGESGVAGPAGEPGANGQGCTVTSIDEGTQVSCGESEVVIPKVISSVPQKRWTLKNNDTVVASVGLTRMLSQGYIDNLGRHLLVNTSQMQLKSIFNSIGLIY